MSRKWRIIISLTVILLIGISIFIFYRSKENPRVYLNEELNILYVDENLQEKNLEEQYSILDETKLKTILNRYRKEFQHLKGIYFLSDQPMEDFVHKTSSGICVLDFGYYYPFILWKLKKSCKEIDGMYILKKKYSETLFRGEDIYIKCEKGNFIVGKSRGEIERYLDKERYLNKVLIDVLEREKEKKLGIFLVNLQKDPVARFNEFYLTGDILKSDKIEFVLKLKGKNDMVENFQNIYNDGLFGKKILDKNVLYIRSRKKEEIEILKGFFNYFCEDSRLQVGNSHIMVNNLVASTSKTKPVDIRMNTFLYGDFLLNDKNEIEIEGNSDYNELTIKCMMLKKSLKEILDKVKKN